MLDQVTDHRKLIASLSPEDRRTLTEKSDAAGLAQLALHAAAIILVGALILLRIQYWPLLLPVQGILVIFLFSLEHEAIHGTAFRSGWINDWAARISGFLLTLPPNWFRYFHFAHHRHTQDPENDPELATPKPERLGPYLLHVSGIPLWWSAVKTLFRNAAGFGAYDFVPQGGKQKIRREAQAMLALYALLLAVSIAAGSAALLFVWVIPAILGQPFLRLYLLTEHGRCPFVANMLENTRTTFTNAFVRRLAWNMPYHAEHHAYPVVPFHKLPAFHAIARKHLRETERGYARFHARYVEGLGTQAENRPAE